MSEAEKSIFNERATEKLRSPDDLDKYIRVTNPSVWVVLAACVVLLAGLLMWGVLGSVTTNVTTTGVSIEGEAMCFLDAESAAKVHVGDVANVDGVHLAVASISDVPISQDEAHAILESDYLVSTLAKDKWDYLISFEGNTSELKQGVPLAVSITAERTAPISLILGSRA